MPGNAQTVPAPQTVPRWKPLAHHGAPLGKALGREKKEVMSPSVNCQAHYEGTPAVGVPGGSEATTLRSHLGDLTCVRPGFWIVVSASSTYILYWWVTQSSSLEGNMKKLIFALSSLTTLKLTLPDSHVHFSIGSKLRED